MEAKGKKAMTVVLIVVAILVALVCVLTLVLAYVVMNGKRPTLDEAWEWQSARYDTSFYEDLQKTDYLVTGHDGYQLHVHLVKNPNPTDRYVILTHANTDNHIGSLKYVQLFMGLGYNCIVYDMRGHGEDVPTHATYGLIEGKDLAELVKDTRARYPQISQLGLHGESMGGSTGQAGTCVTFPFSATQQPFSPMVISAVFPVRPGMDRANSYRSSPLPPPKARAASTSLGFTITFLYSPA